MVLAPLSFSVDYLRDDRELRTDSSFNDFQHVGLCSCSTLRPTPSYEALLHQDRIYLPHRGGRVSHALEQLRVGSAMTTHLVTIPATASVSEAVKKIEHDDFSTYPVVNEQGGFVGIVTEVRLRRTAAEGGMDELVNEIAQPGAHVEPEHTLVRGSSADGEVWRSSARGH